MNCYDFSLIWWNILLLGNFILFYFISIGVTNLLRPLLVSILDGLSDEMAKP